MALTGPNPLARSERHSAPTSLVIAPHTVDNRPNQAHTQFYIPDRRYDQRRTRPARAGPTVRVRTRSGPEASQSETQSPGESLADHPGSLAESHRGDTPKQFADFQHRTSDMSS